ncbi:MAG: dockerin type I domain-containing protein [Wenzhouxiangellaceae bacterium]
MVISQPVEASPVEIRYRVTDLGALGGPLANAFAINNHGVIVGQAEIVIGEIQSTNAFVWQAGSMSDLGSLNTFGTGSVAVAINEFGEIVGAALAPDPDFENALSSRPFLWSASTGITQIRPLDDVDGLGMAMVINDLGEVAGFLGDTGFRWSVSAGGLELPSLPGAPFPIGEPHAINNPGEIVGRAMSESGFVVPALWTSENQVIVLPAVGPRGTGWARDINDRSQIVGEAEDEVGRTAPVLWQNDSIEIIPFLDEPGRDWGSAEDINNLGTIVGWDGSVSVNGVPAKGWVRYPDGRKIALNELIIDPEGEWDIQVPLGINDLGQIVGIAVRLDDAGVPIPGVAFLLDPVPAVECEFDLSNDGRVDGDDMFVLRRALGTTRENADLNGDGRVDHRDVRRFLIGRARSSCGAIDDLTVEGLKFSDRTGLSVAPTGEKRPLETFLR